MNGALGRRLFPVAVVALILAGVLAPVMAFGVAPSASQGPTQGQLAMMISVAESSKTYAHTVVDAAASHRLAVASAQALLSQGDRLLAAAEGQASGTNATSGVESAQAAMRLYTSAAISASVALGDAGFTSSVDYALAAGAIAEVNATVSAVASNSAQACAGASSSTSSSSALAQACARVDAQVAAASMDLSQSASLLVQSNREAGATVDYSQANALIASARLEIGATQSELLTIASYTYTQRGQAFVAEVIIPLSSEANATIRLEQGVQANFTQLQEAFAAYSQSQLSASGAVDSSASALAGAITKVETIVVSGNISKALGVAGQVKSDMDALLNIQALLAFPNVVSGIDASLTATASYTSALNVVEADSAAYPETKIPGFSSYLAALTSDSASVRSAGAAYTSAYGEVVANLSALLAAVPAVQTTYDNLAGLRVLGSVGAVETSLQQETAAMVSVNTDISAFASVVSTYAQEIIVPATSVSGIASLTASAGAYLNSSGLSAVSRASAFLEVAVGDANSFVASADQAAQTSIGAFSTTEGALAASRASLTAQTQSTVTAFATANAFLRSDVHSRSSAAATGMADVNAVLQLFASLNVAEGTTIMAQAIVELQAASTVAS